MFKTLRYGPQIASAILLCSLATWQTVAHSQTKPVNAQASGKSAQSSGKSGDASLPEMESEFFNDFTGKVKSGERIQIRRTLRKAAEMSQMQTAIVVINAMSDYPGLPQEFPKFAGALSKGWTEKYNEFAPAMIVIFSLKDRKFGVTKQAKVSQLLSDDLKKAISSGRVPNELRNNNIGRAMRLTADVIADKLPQARRRARAAPVQATGSRPPPKPPSRATRQAPTRRVASPPTSPPRRRRGGFRFSWIIGIIVIIVIISLVSSLFRGARRGYGGGRGGGYYGGGGGGGGSFMGGMLTGGLMGYMFGGGARGWGGGHDNHGSGVGGYVDDSHGGGGDWGGGGDDWGGGGGGFDSFDGGGFDGGGSFGEW